MHFSFFNISARVCVESDPQLVSTSNEHLRIPVFLPRMPFRRQSSTQTKEGVFPLVRKADNFRLDKTCARGHVTSEENQVDPGQEDTP